MTVGELSATWSDEMDKTIERRQFIQSALAAIPLSAMSQVLGSQRTASAVVVTSGTDRFKQMRNVGPNALNFKVSTRDTAGRLFILEAANASKGGPPRHLHYEQEEWFHVLEGEYLFEVGAERTGLKAGDSLLAPRMVPHVWAHVGDKPGRVLMVFQPAGKMEPYFEVVANQPALQQDASVLAAHGMRLIGPPLRVE
jgi:quercetin dioxygenase-like cupin family protein